MQGLPLEKLLSIASFSIAIGGLVVKVFFPAGPKKEALIVVIIAFLFLTTGVSLYQVRQHDRRVEAMATEIVNGFGNEMKTIDQITEGLHKPDPAIVDEAIDRLVNEKQLGHEVVPMGHDSAGKFRVRTYYVISWKRK